MYLDFFGLKANPFADVPDPVWYVGHAGAERALADLIYAVEREDPVAVLDGEAGSGKTLLLGRLLQTLNDSHEVQVVHFTTLDAGQLLAFVVDGFDASSDGGDTVANLRAIRSFLGELVSRDKRAVLVIDDAHCLEARALQQMLQLSATVIGGARPLSLVLAGDFSANGGVPRSVAERSRFASRLAGLAEDDAARYVARRWQVAGGGEAPNFEGAALSLAVRQSGGMPRAFNRALDGALCIAAMLESRSVGEDMMLRALARFGGEPVADSLAPLAASSGAGAHQRLSIQDNTGEHHREVALSEGIYSIGRADDCDIQLSSSHVSRYHVRIEVGAGAATLIDLGSVNRAIVNGVPVTSHHLEDGDEIQLGEYTLQYQVAA